jgi:hypothetical protein
MKAIALLSTTALLLLLGCTHEAPTPEPLILPHVGIQGVVSYGQGDCLPVIDLSKRSYSPYNGEVYFYRKAALDQLGRGDLAQLQAVSPHYPVRDGQLAAVPRPTRTCSCWTPSTAPSMSSLLPRASSLPRTSSSGSA